MSTSTSGSDSNLVRNVDNCPLMRADKAKVGPRYYCWDWGEVCTDFKGPVEAESSEFVEIELYYQEGGEEMLTLRGEAAQIARETLGGKWEAKMQVEVLFFDDGDKNCRVKARE
ncbi:hypothetical protein IMSHALPRED_002465 [Imshaugia aleurites]|uniref:Uncharacterized protein n=1 Tax=Imshaugia aleurites TaxID=172621 RepID=A0A8H3J5N3_9LECA|nr:hypothetical protein IMSHALPRED_002465 [Imshaugia aleurites]